MEFYIVTKIGEKWSWCLFFCEINQLKTISDPNTFHINSQRRSAQNKNILGMTDSRHNMIPDFYIIKMKNLIDNLAHMY